MWNRAALLTPREMDAADRIGIGSGMSSADLMNRAGQAVAHIVLSRFPAARTVAVLAGPGSNGGDGFIAALRLSEAGLSVDVFSLSEKVATNDVAAAAKAAWGRPVEPAHKFLARRYDLVVDGLFGAGLARAVTGEAATLVAAVAANKVPVVAIDLPSGISALTGEVLGTAFHAEITVTFFRRKPGHLLMPGRDHCGETIVADIGLPTRAIEEISPRCFVNGPDIWGAGLAPPSSSGHKYDRGHAVVFSGGPTKTGAARLAAMAALRTGAGLVTVFSPSSALLVNASHLTAIMLARCNDREDLHGLMADERLSSFVLGPGFGKPEMARDFSLEIIRAGRGLVLDADGLTAYSATPNVLFDAAKSGQGAVVLTPHGGEFARLFPDIAANRKLAKHEKAREAAARSGAVLVLKGADTVIARPDGIVAINETGTPFLATAGSGDVLAGIVAGLLAQKRSVFEVAAAAVWLHGRAAEIAGPGLIAEDLPLAVAKAMAQISQKPSWV